MLRPLLARPHHPGRAGSKMNAALQLPASPTPGPCPSRAGWTCCPPASARPWASRSWARTWPRSSASREQIGGRGVQGGGHAQRVRRARGGRLLPGLRPQARRARPLRPERRRREHDGDDGGGRRQPSTTVEGRERYGINVRYAAGLPRGPPALKRVLLPLPNGQGQIPMEAIADVRARPRAPR